MKCPKCNSKETRVSCTENHEDFTKRYCRCLNCKARFRTTEKYLNTIENPRKAKGSFVKLLPTFLRELAFENKDK